MRLQLRQMAAEAVVLAANNAGRFKRQALAAVFNCKICHQNPASFQLDAFGFLSISISISL